MEEKKFKIIKLSGTHYIGVDDSEIKEGKYFFANQGLRKCIRVDENTSCPYITLNRKDEEIGHFKTWKGVVTHSFGVELEGVINKPLSEVEELIYGYSVKKMAEIEFPYKETRTDYATEECRELWKKGFNAHKKLVKDKLFTVEELYTAFSCGRTYEKSNHQGVGQSELLDYIKSLQKTEWECTINEQGKLKLI